MNAGPTDRCVNEPAFLFTTHQTPSPAYSAVTYMVTSLPP
jgi:hypothetical protein